MSKTKRDLPVDPMDLVFDHIQHGAMVCDARGYVTHINKPYCDFLGHTQEYAVGRHVLDVVENSRMHIVAQTGRAEINQLQRVKDRELVVQRVPIKVDGKVIAVWGQVIFRDVAEVGRLAERLAMLESRVRLYEEELSSLRRQSYTLESIKGLSPAMERLRGQVKNAAAGGLPVLITGESGVGKELVAQVIHRASPRQGRPLVRINCAAIPQDMFEGELFGYEPGILEGSGERGRPGKLELAHGGTVFLDEVEALPAHLQTRLLRVLDAKAVERVGGTTPVRADFRLIAASNQDLRALVEAGRFRGELLLRLGVISLEIPPLRARREDIPTLARHCLRELAEPQGNRRYRLDQTAQQALMAYDWPGNVRELFAVLERMVTHLEGDNITCDHLPVHVLRAGDQACQSLALDKAVGRSERQALEVALQASGGNKAKAARLLGIHRTVLYRKLRRHGLGLDGLPLEGEAEDGGAAAEEGGAPRPGAVSADPGED